MGATVGKGTCPLGAAVGDHHEAAVKRQAKGGKGLYWTCDECGTLQPLKPGGQAAMQQLVEEGWITLLEPASEEAQDQEHEAAEVAKEEQQREVKTANERQSKGSPLANSIRRAGARFMDEEGF